MKGFTLLEVLISLAILAMSLTVFLETQASSLNNAVRSRDMTIATLLARAKMIDIEQKLADEGFTMGESREEGDFREEEHADYKWSYTVSEIEFDLGGLSSMCGAMEDESGNCQGMLSGLGGGMMTSLTDEISRSLRVVNLTVTWNEGKYSTSMSVRGLVAREDFVVPQ